ncbi:hypothetical protein [Endozoicomonas sp. YOMI1]|uniref:hypothetical protein n=1 Tax=Endozoicomonas sp. YOMI1 TaxID=2828739 RepID=UPI0021490D89|nr:hypothetical protein [Endozoicomonas sp. YOMI1]
MLGPVGANAFPVIKRVGWDSAGTPGLPVKKMANGILFYLENTMKCFWEEKKFCFHLEVCRDVMSEVMLNYLIFERVTI